MSVGIDKHKARHAARSAALVVLCVTLFAPGCSRSHIQETVTVASRAATAPIQETAVSDDGPRALDVETEAAGDAVAHAIVALKKKRRDEALYYMNLAHSRLTVLQRRVSRPAVNESASVSPTRERLMIDLLKLESAERFARRNDYQQSATELHSINDELDHLNATLNHPLN
jgi:hypothetical protein